MNIIETVAPISIENLKKYFTDKTTFFVIDYKNSTLKSTKLLTYLSNLDIPCDINFKDCSNEEFFGVIEDYLNTTMLLNIPSLEKATISILHQTKELVPALDKEFIEKNKEILNKWISKLESLTLYNMYIVKDETFKEFVDGFEVDESNELIGINFISLLKCRDFYSFYKNTKQENLKFYSHYFNDYMFKGKNMYSYWANENNPLFLLTYGIAEGIVTGESYNLAKQKTIEEFKNVAPV